MDRGKGIGPGTRRFKVSIGLLNEAGTIHPNCRRIGNIACFWCSKSTMINHESPEGAHKVLVMESMHLSKVCHVKDADGNIWNDIVPIR